MEQDAQPRFLFWLASSSCVWSKSRHLYYPHLVITTTAKCCHSHHHHHHRYLRINHCQASPQPSSAPLQPPYKIITNNTTAINTTNTTSIAAIYLNHCKHYHNHHHHYQKANYSTRYIRENFLFNNETKNLLQTLHAYIHTNTSPVIASPRVSHFCL